MPFFTNFNENRRGQNRPAISTSKTVQESQIVRKVPYIGSDFLTNCLVRLVLTRFSIGKFLTTYTHNLYFTTAYVLAVVGVFNYLRYYHRDQFRSYGLYDHSPGVAEQLQPQNIATFNFDTLPTVLEKSTLLVPPQETLPNALTKFALTPFVDRVDVYPEALIVQFNDVWADLMGRNFFITYPQAVSQDPDAIQQWGFASTQPGTEREAPPRHRADPWASVRGLVDVLDEFPAYLEQTTEPAPHTEPSALHHPAVMRPVRTWYALQYTHPAHHDSILTSGYQTHPAPELATALALRAPTLTTYAHLIGSVVDVPQSTLIHEFFEPGGIDEGGVDSWTSFKTQGKLPLTPDFGMTGAQPAMTEPDTFLYAHLTRKDSTQLRLGPPVAPTIPEMPNAPFTQASADASRKTIASRWTDLKRDACVAGETTKSILADLGRALFPVKKQYGRPKFTPPPVLNAEPETPLEVFEREAARKRVQDERKEFLDSRPAGFKAYIKSVRKYRAKLRAHNADVKRLTRRFEDKARAFSRALGRAEDVELFWKHSLPEVIQLNTEWSPTVGAKASSFIADSTTPSTAAWLRATRALSLPQDPGAGTVPNQVTAQHIAEFIQFAIQNSEVPTFDYGSQSRRMQHVIDFLPYDMLSVPYPEHVVSELRKCQQKGGYTAFYSLLEKAQLSAGPVESNASLFNAKVPPARQHFQPIIEWVDAVQSGELNEAVRFTMPPGNEYHWAHTMQRFLSTREGAHELMGVLQKNVKRKARIRVRYTHVFEKLQREINTYLEAVSHLDVRPPTTGPDELGLRYATLLADLNAVVACHTDLDQNLQRSLDQGFLRDDATALSTSIPTTYPHTDGFAFPDFDFDEIELQWEASAARYRLAHKTPWEQFKAMVQRRPIEVLIPAGYRPFMEDVFSSSQVEEEEQVNVIPKYVFDRQVAYYPAYDGLQKLYGDLDVSFLPEKPLPKAYRSPYVPEEQMYNEDELNPVSLRKEYYFRFKRALLRSPLTGEVYPQPSSVKDFFLYALSPANWVKDRPANFRGQAARLISEPTNRGQDQHQIILAQMGAYPEFAQDSDLLEVDTLSAEEQKREFPLKLHGYRRELFYTTNFEELSADEKDSLFEKYLLYNNFMDVVPDQTPRRYGWLMWFDAARELPQLDTEDDLYMPRLTMDEWHSLFKTSLQTADETNDPEFLLDMPVLLIHGAAVSQPGGFDGIIYKSDTRSKLLTQVLMAITEHNYGAYDVLGYDNMVNVLNYQDQQVRFGQRPKLIPHFEMPKDELQPEPTGAPTWMESSSWRTPSHGIGRWASAENYILETTGHKRKPRDWSKFTNPIRTFLQKLPGGNRLTRRHVFYDNVEPITPYWWLYAGKLVFYAWLYRVFWFMWGASWEELKMILLDNFGGRRLRALFVDLGIENPFTYRVIIENPNTFRSSAGALNNNLFVQACESVVHLRNKCRPGTSMPKGLLLTGVPGTGKTFMVQMIAGESGVPVITQTAGELFNKRNLADLDMEQCFTPAEQLGFAFARARQLAPSILFIDEIDALGESRENVMMSTLDKQPDPDVDLYGYLRVKHTPAHKPLVPKLTLKERSLREIFTKRTVEAFRKDRRKLLTYEQYPGAEPARTGEIFVYKDEMIRREMQQVGALTEFLVQMDGLKPLEGVLVIGATNRVQVLDPAITRPGRLEQIVELFPPGARERAQIFRKECFKLGATRGIPWGYLVNRTRGLTVANLTTAINHSAIRAISTDSYHTLETLEYGLETMLRHKRAVKMIATRPMPDPKTVRTRDPYLFARVAYYQAGRALLQNVLPDHPSLPFVKLAVEPFDPEYSIRDLFLHNYNRTELEVRLIGLHAGKAAEYLMLYGGKPGGIIPTALHLLESDQGADELAFAAELANAMVDEWFLYEDTRLPIRLNSRANDNVRNYKRPIDIESRESMEYWADVHAKSFARLQSERDRPPIDVNTKSYPPGHTIYQRFEELAYWATTVSRIELNAITKDYIQWYNYYLRQPFRHERSRFWIPPDLYFHEDPATLIDFDQFMDFVQNSDTDWDSARKGWDDQVREWDPTGEMLPESKRPMLVFPDWHLVDRDYIMQSLMGVSFETALNVLNEFRPLLDMMAKHLLRSRILRQDDINTYIRQYTETRIQAGASTPIDLEDFSNTDTLPGLKNNMTAPTSVTALPPLIAPIDYMRPDEEFIATEENQFLIYERSWGPASRRPYDKTIPLSHFNNKDILHPLQRRGAADGPQQPPTEPPFEDSGYLGASPRVNYEEGEEDSSEDNSGS